MFFSTKEFHEFVVTDAPMLDAGTRTYVRNTCNRLYGTLSPTRKQAAAILAAARKAIIAREYDAVVYGTRMEYGRPVMYSFNTGKFLRPWHVVPKLRDFRPPQGDYGVGVEVEYGFRSRAVASATVMHIKNWKYIAVDAEGGTHGVETTFAPVLYSKLNKKSQCFRYLDYLASSNDVIEHDPTMQVGTHVNVSAHTRLDGNRCDSVASTIRHSLTRETQIRFFGRPRPYGCGVVRGTVSGHNYIEWKLFNSTTDSKKLREYINVAVSLTKLVESDAAITTASVIEACERGLLGRVK